MSPSERRTMMPGPALSPPPSKDFEVPEEDKIEQDREVVADQWPEEAPRPAHTEPIIPVGSEADVIDQQRLATGSDDDDERRFEDARSDEAGQ
jgi:hypothetical protein